MIHLSIVSLFPESLDSMISSSVLGRAQKAKLFEVHPINIRDYALDKHKTCDDTPYGGGPGQLMRVDVVKRAIDAAKAQFPDKKTCVILPDPAAPLFKNADAKAFAEFEHLIWVCGRYEGIDARIYHYVDVARSIGDYVLTGGEAATMVMMDATLRYRENILGNKNSLSSESHTDHLLEHGQYTRPEVFEGHEVPEVLKQGHHAKITAYRSQEKLARTRELRPDLWEQLDPKPAIEDSKIAYPWQAKK